MADSAGLRELSAVDVEVPLSDRKFRPDIEGLRAVAVVLVILYHAGVPGLEGGYVGVDVFFVLSGFLITGLLVSDRERNDHISMVKFYARRARRILPAATLVLLATVIASYVYLGFLRGNGTADDGLWTAVFAANIHFAESGTQYLNVNVAPSPLQNYWSLAVEEQFYVVWPLLISLVAIIGRRFPLRARLGTLAVAIIGSSLLWSIIETPTNGTWAYFSPLTRAWELAAGALMAISVPALKRVPSAFATTGTWTGLFLIVASAMVFNSGTSYPGVAVIVPVGGTLLIIAGGTVVPRNGAEILLGTRPFLWVGVLFYSLYLWHWRLFDHSQREIRPLVGIVAEPAHRGVRRPAVRAHISDAGEPGAAGPQSFDTSVDQRGDGTWADRSRPGRLFV